MSETSRAPAKKVQRKKSPKKKRAVSAKRKTEALTTPADSKSRNTRDTRRSDSGEKGRKPPKKVAAAKPAATLAAGIRLPGPLEEWPIERLNPYERNPRTHTDEQVAKIAVSLIEFGWTNPILVDKEDGIIAGHGRLLAAQLLTMKTVPVIVLPHLTDAQKRAYVIADNRLALEAGWDEDLLTEELRRLAAEDFDLGLTGFDLKELEMMLEDEPLAEPPAPEPPKHPVTFLASNRVDSDLWILGEHRVLCGDAMNDDDVARLMEGVRAEMTFTDPPYNVSYGATKPPTHRQRQIKGDNQTAEQWQHFCDTLAKMMASHCSGDVYVWGASGPEGMRQRLRFVAAGFHWSATIIWRKQQLVLTPANYQRIYEPCFYGWHEKSSFVADRTQLEMWDVDRPHQSLLHPTMKPIALCAIGLRNSCLPGGLVLDLFGGSGSTLIAAEETGRRCNMMELDPAYCDVIVRRWQDLTGKTAVLESTGEVFDDVSAARKAAGPDTD